MSHRDDMHDLTLDLCGLLCPLPLLKAKKAMGEIPPLGTLEILATDPGTVVDFEAFCEVTGHELVNSDETDGVFRFIIRRKA